MATNLRRSLAAKALDTFPCSVPAYPPMKAKYVLCMAIVAVACAAQQSADNASVVQLSPAEADKLLVERVVPQYPESGIVNKIQNNELLSLQVGCG
jgi:hypothetical protein